MPKDRASRPFVVLHSAISCNANRGIILAFEALRPDCQALNGGFARMAEEQPKMIPTLSLTGVTVNAMALIAPGAFLWITFVLQAGFVFPSGMAMWFGILVALSLAYATAISYAELAKLYPGAGSSYLFAEQAFLSKTTAYRFARIAKFVIGYIVGSVFPNTINPGTPGPLFMAVIAIVFSYAVAYIAYRGVSGSTNV